MAAFLDNFEFINQLTRDTKVLLSFYFKDVTYYMGQEVFSEGDPVEYIYLVSCTQIY